MSTSAIIAEGKTKFVVDASRKRAPDGGCPTCPKVQIVYKDDLEDASKSLEEMSSEAKADNTTTVNIFKLLASKGIGIPTHFLSWCNDRSFFALRAEMIPFEIVTRRIATGSYTKRYPDIWDGTKFPVLVSELFYKLDEKRPNPIVVLGHQDNYISLYDPERPIKASSSLGVKLLNPPDYDQMQVIALQAFLILEEACKELGAVLCDMTIKFGLVDDGLGGKRLVVADAIDSSSVCIWDQHNNQLDRPALAKLTEEFPKARG